MMTSLLQINLFLSILVSINILIVKNFTHEIEQPILESNERELLLENSGLNFKRLIGGGIISKVNKSLNTVPEIKVKKSTAKTFPAYVTIVPTAQSLSKMNSSISKFKTQASTKDNEPSSNIKINGINSKPKQYTTIPLFEAGEKIYPKEKSEYMKFISKLALSNDNLDSLNDGNQLKNFMIDYLILNIIGFHEFHAESKFVYIFSEIGNAFLIKEHINVNKESIINRMMIKDKTLLIPIKDADNVNWNLIIADTAEKTFTFFDPFSSNLRKSKYNMKKFLKFIFNRNKFVDDVEKIDTINWQIKSQDFKIQSRKNWFDSGIYVLMYVDYVIHNRKFTMDAHMYRKRLWNIMQDDNFNKFLDETLLNS